MPVRIYHTPLLAPLAASAEVVTSFVVPVSDGSAFVSLVWVEGADIRSAIRRVDSIGQVSPWPPGEAYPAAVLCCADEAGTLFGFDYTKPNKVYACKPDGSHVTTVTFPFVPTSSQHPHLAAKGDRLFWIDHLDFAKPLVGTVTPSGLADVEIFPAHGDAPTLRNQFLGRTEIHNLTTHLCSDGNLYLLHTRTPAPTLEKYQLAAP